MKIKGQNIRFAMTVKGTKTYLAASTNCQLHIAADLEDSSTKDSTGMWKEQECVGMSWDGSVDVNVIDDALDSALKALDVPSLVGQEVDVEFDLTGGEQNRDVSKGKRLYAGKAIINDWSLTAQNKAQSTATVQFQGNGPLTKVDASE